MAFKNEERRSHIISTNDIFRKICDMIMEKGGIKEVLWYILIDQRNGFDTFVQKENYQGVYNLSIFIH